MLVTMIRVVLINLVPLAGVLFFKWPIFPVVFICWLESVIVGLYNIPKLVILTVREAINYKTSKIQDLLCVPFFLFHFGLWSLATLAAIRSFFGHEMSGLTDVELVVQSTKGVWVAALVMMGGYGQSFVGDFILAKKYRRANVRIQMFEPYGQILLMQVTVFVTAAYLPISGLISLIALKTLVDIYTYLGLTQRLVKWISKPSLSNLKLTLDQVIDVLKVSRQVGFVDTLECIKSDLANPELRKKSLYRLKELCHPKALGDVQVRLVWKAWQKLIDQLEEQCEGCLLTVNRTACITSAFR